MGSIEQLCQRDPRLQVPGPCVQTGHVPKPDCWAAGRAGLRTKATPVGPPPPPSLSLRPGARTQLTPEWGTAGFLKSGDLRDLRKKEGVGTKPSPGPRQCPSLG